MRRINWQTVASNVAEAREELQRLEVMARDPKRRSEFNLELALAHAYHHLNFAWHIRHVSTSRYANHSDADFNRWGRFPNDLELIHLERPRRSSRRKPRS